MPKILWYAHISQCVQISVFPSGKHIFPNSLINFEIRVNGISHSLYVKFGININSLFLNYLSYF